MRRPKTDFRILFYTPKKNVFKKTPFGGMVISANNTVDENAHRIWILGTYGSKYKNSKEKIHFF